MKYWLMKSEPDAFGLDDLQRVDKEWWDGVRNYQARNFMRDDMKVGDKVLFIIRTPSQVGLPDWPWYVTKQPQTPRAGTLRPSTTIRNRAQRISVGGMCNCSTWPILSAYAATGTTGYSGTFGYGVVKSFSAIHPAGYQG